MLATATAIPVLIGAEGSPHPSSRDVSEVLLVRETEACCSISRGLEWKS
jgi:hypothetical protein